MILKRLLFTLTVWLSLTWAAAAQIPEPRSLSEQQQQEERALELKKELENKTLALLEEIIMGATTLKLPENRAIAQSGVADLLWKRDEKRARALFKSALENLAEAARQFPSQTSAEHRRARFSLLQQRREILQMIARHDADLALELMRAIRIEPLQPMGTASSLQPFDEAHVENSLAVQVAINDPKRAFEMAEQTLSRGYSFELLNLLSRLSEKDQETASRLASEIISKLRTENLSTNMEAAWFAMVMLRAGVRGENADVFLQANLANGGRKNFTLDERQVRDLLDAVTAAALRDKPSNTLFSFLPWLMPEIEKRFPERVQALRSRMEIINRGLDPLERVYAENQELIRRGSIDSLMAAAAKAPEKGREVLYEQAAWKAFNQGNPERARQIVNDYIRDSKVRERVLANFDSMALWSDLSKGKLEEVRQRIPRLKSKDERAGALTELAFLASTKKEKKLALELLDEARALVSLKPKNDQQLYTLLAVIRVYALVEPIKAFEMIESLVDQANDLLSAASALSGFLLPSGVFRNGELVMTTGYGNVSTRLSHFGKQLGALALLNFERTKAAADKFQRHEARVMARLFIAQAVLSERLGSGVAHYEGIILSN